MGTLQSRLANRAGYNGVHDATTVADNIDWGAPPVEVP